MHTREIADCSPDRLLLATANLIAESVHNMQSAVNSITELSVPRDRPLPEMIVAFQAFDKLTQEFSALGAMLRNYSYASKADDQRCIEEIVRSIPLSDLRRKVIEATFGSTGIVDMMDIGISGMQSERVF